MRDWSRNKTRKCFWNGFLTIIDGIFILLIVMGFINVDKAYDGFVGYDIFFFFAVLGLLICAIQAILVPFFLCTRIKELDKEENK